MLLRAVFLALIGFAFTAVGQDSFELPKAEEKKSPSLDTDRWLRGELGQTQQKRPFIVTPELKVTPGMRGQQFEKVEGGKCSIPLVEFRFEPNSRMKVLPPKVDGHIRFLKPPAPPCDQADRRQPDPQPQQK